jgi:hypothetical protein
MNELAKSVDIKLADECGPGTTGFILLVFPLGTTGRCNYVSNVARSPGVVEMLRTQANDFELQLLLQNGRPQ